MPRRRRPSATLSRTFSHGISACFWNTTPRSAPGPTTGWPSSRISPVDGGRKPAMQLSSVVLPQPEAPSATTKSPSCIAQVHRRQRLQRAALDGVVDRQVTDVERRHRRLQAGCAGRAAAHHLAIAFCTYVVGDEGAVVRLDLLHAALLLQERRGARHRLGRAAAQPGGRHLLGQRREACTAPSPAGTSVGVGLGPLGDGLDLRPSRRVHLRGLVCGSRRRPWPAPSRSATMKASLAAAHLALTIRPSKVGWPFLPMLPEVAMHLAVALDLATAPGPR